MDYDVVIVGAGPAGSSAAAGLARRGYSVALVDKARFPREKLCGDFLNPINRRIFRELEVEDELLACRHESISGFRITSVSGVSAEAALSSEPGPEHFGLGLSRADLDYILLQNAERRGVAVRQGCRVSGLNKNGGQWCIAIEDSKGLERLRAKILIGADGRNSWVGHRLALTGSKTAAGRSIGFQLRLRGDRAPKNKIEIHLFPGGYAGVVGLGGDLMTLGFAVERRCWSGEPSLRGLLETRLCKNPYLKMIFDRSAQEGEFRSTYPVYFPKRRSFGDGVLLAGDAAQVTEPVTGEGIYFAMTSGLCAAEAVDRAYRLGDTSSAQLAEYEILRRRIMWQRRALNKLIRLLVYRPALLDPVIRLSGKHTGLLDSLVHAVCAPEESRTAAL